MSDFMMAIEILKRNKPTSDPRLCGKELCNACDTAISALEELQQYRAIGTLEECREAREKQQRRKPLMDSNPDIPDSDIFICQMCSRVVGIDDVRTAYCANCGQAIDWKEEMRNAGIRENPGGDK